MRNKPFRHSVALVIITALLAILIMGLAVSTSFAATTASRTFPAPIPTTRYHQPGRSGIISGYTNGSFGPTTQSQAAVRQDDRPCPGTAGERKRLPESAVPFVDWAPTSRTISTPRVCGRCRPQWPHQWHGLHSLLTPPQHHPCQVVLMVQRAGAPAVLQPVEIHR